MNWLAALQLFDLLIRKGISKNEKIKLRLLEKFKDYLPTFSECLDKLNKLIKFRKTFNVKAVVILWIVFEASDTSQSRIKSNEFWIDFFQIFGIFFHILNQSNCKFSNRMEQILNESNFWKFD